MRLPKFTRILPSEFSEVDWFPRLANLLNRPLELFDQALRNKLTFESNFQGKVIELTLDGNYPKKIQWTLRSRPKHLIVTNGTGNITSHPFIDWSLSNNQIVINNVTGITATTSDKVKLTAIFLIGD